MEKIDLSMTVKGLSVNVSRTSVMLGCEASPSDLHELRAHARSNQSQWPLLRPSRHCHTAEYTQRLG